MYCILVFERENITFEHPEEAPQDAGKILAVARDARIRQSAALSASVDYFRRVTTRLLPFAIKKNGGTVLAEYFYSGSEFVDVVSTEGNLSSVAYYG